MELRLSITGCLYIWLESGCAFHSRLITDWDISIFPAKDEKYVGHIKKFVYIHQGDKSYLYKGGGMRLNVI
jgi:hypothetical protein